MLKEAATKKLRLSVWAYSLGEYLYILSKNGPTLRMRGKQSVRKGVWYIGGNRRQYSKRQRRGTIPFGLIASGAVPFLGEVAKPLLKKMLVVGVGEDEDERKNSTGSPCCSQTS